MAHDEQQREVVNQQQETLNLLLATLASRPRFSSCYRCGKNGHIVRDYPDPTPVTSTQGEQETSPKEASGKRKDSIAVSPAVEEVNNGLALGLP